jgi:NADH-quinone oxidoreductase subunit M
VAELALTVSLLASFDTGDGRLPVRLVHTWIAEWGIAWNLGVDGISLFLVVLTGLLFPLASSAPTRTTTPSRTWPGSSSSRPA